MDSSSPSGAKPSLMSMPEMPRVLPFVIFLAVGALAGKAFAGSEYWMYAAKTLGVGALLWFWRRRLPEMRWAFSVEGVVVGIVIAVLWLGLSGQIPSLGRTWDLIREATGGPAAPTPKAMEAWNPVAFFQGQPLLGWAFVMIRVLGRSLVVPALEELEADVYWCLARLVEGIQDHYTPSQPGIQRMIHQMRELVHRINGACADGAG
jgi:hypothetical protein